MTTITETPPAVPAMSAAALHSAALQRHADAVAAAEALRARARNGDDSVTGGELHAAVAEVELAALRLPAAEAAAKIEAEAALDAERQAAVARFEESEALARQGFMAALDGVRRSLAALTAAGRDYDQVVDGALSDIEWLGTDGRFDLLHRPANQYDQPLVKGARLRKATLSAWVTTLLAEANGQPVDRTHLHPKESN